MINKVIELIKKNKMIILYLIFGVLSTIVNIASYAISTNIFKIEYLISNIIAWIISVTFAYITNKIFVFESKVAEKKKLVKEFLLFYYYRIVSLIMEMLILYVCVDLLKFNDMVIKVIANILIIILNYLFSKFFVFKKNSNE